MSDIPTSGMISLNQMHTEAGGTSGTACTINDADIRGLINKTSGAAMNFAEWYGASSSLDTQTVTVGSKYQYYQTWRGHWNQSPAIGSISDGVSDIYGAVVNGIVWASTNRVLFYLLGNRANSGWSTMKVGSTTLNRSSATHSASTYITSWIWTSVSDPFGSNGTTTTVVFN